MNTQDIFIRGSKKKSQNYYLIHHLKKTFKDIFNKSHVLRKGVSWVYANDED